MYNLLRKVEGFFALVLAVSLCYLVFIILKAAWLATFM